MNKVKVAFGILLVAGWFVVVTWWGLKVLGG